MHVDVVLPTWLKRFHDPLRSENRVDYGRWPEILQPGYLLSQQGTRKRKTCVQQLCWAFRAPCVDAYATAMTYGPDEMSTKLVAQMLADEFGTAAVHVENDRIY